MRLTKRQLKRIIREEYSRLKRRGLLREFNTQGATHHVHVGHDPAFRQEIMMAIEDLGMTHGDLDIAFMPTESNDMYVGLIENVPGAFAGVYRELVSYGLLPDDIPVEDYLIHNQN